MNNDLDNKYFIILNKDEIIFSCLSNENKISFTKKYTLINGPSDLFEELQNFFIDNLIKIEKTLKDFIKKIYIIIDTDNSLSVNLSIKYKLETEKINYDKINELLSYLKYQFTKYSYDQKVIHMTISKLVVDDKENNFSFAKENSNNLILEVKFECLKKQTVQIINKICSNYQISVKKILLVNHLSQFIKYQTENIVFAADKFLRSEDNNEVSWISKKPIKLGFFEKFFKLFG